MAGFRLAPRAAQARRSPWQRRRLQLTTPQSLNRTVEDAWTFGDWDWFQSRSTLTHTIAYQKTVTDGWAISDSLAGANPSSGTATGGLIFLFSQGTVGSAYSRSVTDGWAISDSLTHVLTPVGLNSYARTVSDGWTISDAVSGVYVVGTATPGLVGIDLDFTSVLDVELVLIGE